MHLSITAARVGSRAVRGCRRLRSERGSMLVEIMMSALLLALAATAVFKGIDGANATSGGSKSRAVATTLAQEDQERLRSLDPRGLDGYTNTAQKVVNRVPFTVVSAGAVVSDRGSNESCTKGSGRVTYMRVTSTITWPDMRGSKPVNASTLVSVGNAYSRGSLSVRIQDAHAVPVEGVGVNVTSPVSRSGTTNASGCVVWDGLATGTYLGSFSKTGYVDPSGVNNATPPNGWSVTTGSTGVYTHLYDLAGSAHFKFVGKSGTNTYPNVTASGITVSHPTMPTPGNVRTASFTANNLVTFNNLFPFLTPYSAWAGTCDDNTPPAGFTASATVPAGATASPDPINVEMPVLSVRVRQSGANYNGADVTVRPIDSACGGTVTLPISANGGIPGTPDQRVFPFGSYNVCADDNASTSHRIQQQINLTTTNAVTATDLVIPTNFAGRGSC